MPRKPANELDNAEKKKKPTTTTKTLKGNSTTKNPTAKDLTEKKATSTKESSTNKPVTKKTTAKKATTAKSATKKTTSKKATATKSVAKKSTTKKTVASKSDTKKVSTKKSSIKTKKVVEEINAEEITSSTDLTKKIEVLEYYDLPYRYNKTVVKVLAQTPTTLFIYWDISDIDRSNFVEQYGEDFFNYTKPVLIIHNNTMNYSFEIDIDDFANSWYLHVNDSNCEYIVELGRKPKYYNEERHINIQNNYLYVASSNVIDSPNDRVLFDKNLKTVYFKDVKTNIITAKDITSISFLRNMGRIYNLYDLQSDFTKNNWINSNHWQLDLKNPSSSNPSSTFR